MGCVGSQHVADPPHGPDQGCRVGTEPAEGREPTEDRAARTYAEPTHDELVRGWTKVSQWLDEIDTKAGTRALLGALGEAVRSWRAHQQTDSYLWNDPRIDLLSALGQVRPRVFNADEARFVKRGVYRRRMQRMRLIGGLLTVIVVLTVAAGVALWQRQRASDEAKRANQNADEANQPA